MAFTPAQLSSLLAIPGAAQQVCDLLNQLESSESSDTSLTTGSTGSFTTAADITTTGELKGGNLEVTGTAKFDGAVEGLPAASEAAAGVVKAAVNISDVAESTATDVTTLVTDHNKLVNNFNNLLGFMTQAGQMSS